MDTKLQTDYYIKELQFKLDEEMDRLQEIKQSMLGEDRGAVSANLAMIESGLQTLLDSLYSIRGRSSKYERIRRIRKVFSKEVGALFKYIGVN